MQDIVRRISHNYVYKHIESMFKVKVAKYILHSILKVQVFALVMDSVIYSYQSNKDDAPVIRTLIVSTKNFSCNKHIAVFS